jgi:hypothetical protein
VLQALCPSEKPASALGCEVATFENVTERARLISQDFFDIATLPSDLDHVAAAALLKRLHTFETQSLESHLKPQDIVFLEEWYQTFWAEKVGTNLKGMALGEATVKVDALRTKLSTMFPDGSVSLDLKTKDAWGVVAAFDLVEFDLPGIRSVAASLNEKALVNQLGIIDVLQRVLVALAELEQFLLVNTTRDERKISATSVKLCSALRCACVVYQGCMKSIGTDVFAKGSGHLEGIIDEDFLKLLGTRGAGAHLEMTAQWIRDLEELNTLVCSWIPAGWQAVKADLLEVAHSNVLEALLMNPNYKTLSDGSALLELMRNLIKKLSADGAGSVAPPNLLKDVGATCVSATETVVVTFALYHLLKVIPSETNVNKRKADAKTILDQTKVTKVDIGQSITARAQLLLSGCLPAHLAPQAVSV